MVIVFGPDYCVCVLSLSNINTRCSGQRSNIIFEYAYQAKIYPDYHRYITFVVHPGSPCADPLIRYPSRVSGVRIWDRAALVAIRPEDREEYAATCDSLLKPGGRILLLTLVYNQEKMSGRWGQHIIFSSPATQNACTAGW